MSGKIAVVCSGGGFDGFFAILGAAQELDRRHNVHAWGGTSAGAIVAAVMASRVNVNELVGAATDIDLAPSDLDLSEPCLRSSAPLLSMLREFLPATLGEVSGRLKICTTNLTTGRAVVWNNSEHSWAPLPELVLASTAIPGVFAPVRIGRYYHCDGGITHNLLSDAYPLLPSIAVSAFQDGREERPAGRMARAKWLISRVIQAAMASNIREDLEDATDLRSLIRVPRVAGAGLRSYWRIHHAVDAMEAGAMALES